MSASATARDFKFCTRVGHVKYWPFHDQVSPKWMWSGSQDPFLHFGVQAIFLEQMKLHISNLVCILNVKSTGITCVIVLQSLDDLEGHLPNAGLITCNSTNICVTFSTVLTDTARLAVPRR